MTLYILQANLKEMVLLQSVIQKQSENQKHIFHMNSYISNFSVYDNNMIIIKWYMHMK